MTNTYRDIDGTPDLAKVFAVNVKIEGRGAGIIVAQEPPDVIKTGSGLQEMGRKAMSQGVPQGLLLDACFQNRALQNELRADHREAVYFNTFLHTNWQNDARYVIIEFLIFRSSGVSLIYLKR